MAFGRELYRGVFLGYDGERVGKENGGNMKATVVKGKEALEWMPLTLLPANCLFTSKERLSSRWLKMDRLMFFIHDDGRMVYVTTIADGEFAVVKDEKVVLEF